MPARQLTRNGSSHSAFRPRHVKVVDGVPQRGGGSSVSGHCSGKEGQKYHLGGVADGEVPVVAGGPSPAYYHGTANVLGSAVTIGWFQVQMLASQNSTNKTSWASDCSYLAEVDNQNLRYLYLLLNHRQIDLTAMQKGAAQPHIYPKDLRKTGSSGCPCPTSHAIFS